VEIILGTLLGIFIAAVGGTLLAHGVMPWQTDPLQSSEHIQRYKIIFDKSPIGVFFCRGTGSGQFLDANETFCQMVGYTLAELKLLDWRTITHPEDLAHDENNIVHLEQGDYEVLSNHNKRYYRKDGSIIHIKLYARSLFQDNILLYYVCHAIDNSHEVAMQSSLDEKNAQLVKLHDRLESVNRHLDKLKNHTNKLIKSSGASHAE
jgi:PAS domain S-box-containing protein